MARGLIGLVVIFVILYFTNIIELKQWNILGVPTMRAAIIALSLMFGSQVGAEWIEVGDVYFCNMTEFLEIDKSSD